MEGTSCSGLEESILECRVTLGYHFCSHEDDASVKCIGRVL